MNNYLQDEIDEKLLTLYKNGPSSLIEIYKYILSAKGKRIRPMLTILTSKAIYGNYNKAFIPALCIEILHNFTLVHDDIMDNDSLRHGKKTVHNKWDNAYAILSGDMLLAISLQKLIETNPSNRVLNSFMNGLLAVCEGQALDKEFETSKLVTKKEYLYMIEKKTAHLIGMSLEIGGLVYNCSEKTGKNLFNFGVLIGKAFQIQDDLLEIMSNPDNMKKSLHSDIILGKKTYPMILCREIDDNKINQILNQKDENIKNIIKNLREFIINNNVDRTINDYIENIYSEAYNIFNKIKFKNSNILIEFTNKIKNRTM
jgi:geranylgeranyl pyrophosphate synthase